MRKLTNHGEYLSALEFVKTDIENLTQHVRNGVIVSSEDVVTRVMYIKNSFDIFLSTLGIPQVDTSYKLTVEKMVEQMEEVALQNKNLQVQNQDLISSVTLMRDGHSSAGLLNEIMNVKENVTAISDKLKAMSEVKNINMHLDTFKNGVSQELFNIEQRLTKNMEIVANQTNQKIEREVRTVQSGVKENPNFTRQIEDIYLQEKNIANMVSNITKGMNELNQRINMLSENSSNSAKEDKRLEYLCRYIDKTKNDILDKSNFEGMENAQESMRLIQMKFAEAVKDNFEYLKGEVRHFNDSISISSNINKTSLQVLRALSKQIIAIYNLERKVLSNIESMISENHTGGDLTKGFDELKSELSEISEILSSSDMGKITNFDKALATIDEQQNMQYTPTGLLETVKSLEELAKDLDQLNKEGR